MESYFFLFVNLAILLVQGNAQNELDVKFKNPADRYVELGAEVVMEYEINQSPMFALENHVYMWRNIMKDGAMVQSKLFDAVKAEKDSNPEFYRAVIVSNMERLIIQFKILKVRDIDDATFQVQVVDKGSNAEKNASLKVIVLRDNDKLQMKFGDYDFFSESMSAPFEVDAGKYSVACQSEGSNPATENLRIFWKGEEIKGSAVKSEKMSTPLTKYRSMISAEVEIEVADSAEYVECVAESKLGNKLTTKAPIKVNVYDPEVECTDNDTYLGKRYLVLSCIVTEAGHEIESYAYEHGKTGEMIVVDTQNSQFDEVIKEDLGNSKVRVDLKLHKVADSHFTNYYLIITQKSGHITRVPVTLTKVEGPTDSSSIIGASLVTVVLTAVCAIWKTL